MKSWRRIGVGIATYIMILRRQIAKLSGRRLARFMQKLRERSLSMVWRYSVEAIRNGKVIARRAGVGLNTNNWGLFLAAILSGAALNSNISISLTNTSGAAQNLYVYSSYNNGYNNFNVANNTAQAFVQLGGGSGAPSRGNSALQSPITGTSNITFTFNPNANSFTGSTSITYQNPASPSELGLFIVWANTSGSSNTFMLDRAVFATLPSATTFTVSYSVNLS